MSKDILIINNNLDAGGTEVLLRDIVAQLVEGGHKVTLWACNGDKKTLKEKYPPSVAFRRYPFWNGACRRFSPRWFFSRFCRVFFEGFWLKLKKWDVAVAFKEGEAMLLASKLKADKKVSWVHTDYASFHWTTYLFPDGEAERQCMAGFDSIAVVSQAAARGLIDAIGDPGNLKVVLNPINSPAILEKSKAEVLPRPEGKTLFVAVGRLSEVKRFDMLIDICHELSADFPLELWIVGGGELESELKNKLASENISCVKLLGKKDNPYPYIACADWLVSSSASESYGLTVQEALSLGVPVIAAYCPAIAESTPEGCGIITAADREALKSGLAGILSRPGIEHEYRQAVSEAFDAEGLWLPRMNALLEFITD